MKQIGILANPTLDGIGDAIAHFVSLAKGKGFSVLLPDELEEVCEGDGFAYLPVGDLISKVDIVVALGGDGNLLRVASLVQDLGTPILGVNLGRLGFLTGADPSEFEEGLERLLQDSYEVEERMALIARLGDRTAFALNEIVIERSVTARQIQVKAWISDTSLSSFFGNGLIVATPTGSTGYNLSAGGPVIHPTMKAIVVTPICPHSLTLRPMVVPADQPITVQTLAAHSDTMLTADGLTVCSMKPEDQVVVRPAETPVRLINLHGLPFYDVLRQKLDWSRDGREIKE